MRIDLVVSSFRASAADMVEVARCGEDSGFDGVLTFDHFSGSMLGRGWSRDPFTVLGAMAGATTSVRVGPLVANMMNRHPVQLVVAMATLQSLSGGRAVLGLGAGASPGSRFAAEHEAIGTELLPSGPRRRRLVETITVVDALWRGERQVDGEFFAIDGIGELLGPDPRPPIIVGANAWPTVEIALAHADGVNLNLGADFAALTARIAEAEPPPGFEITIYVEADPSAGHGALLSRYRDLPGVTGLTVGVRAPFDLAAVAAMARDLIPS